VTVRLELADGTVYPLMGKVDFVDNELNPDTGTVEVRAVFPNPQGRLASGLFARVGFPMKRDGAVLVPERALQQDLAGRFVLVVNEEDVVEARPVEPGPEFEQYRVIESGLTGEERVVVSGLQRARPGIKVNPQQATPAAPAPEQS
jgi:RND family efflux transporter MFP subunit